MGGALAFGETVRNKYASGSDCSGKNVSGKHYNSKKTAGKIFETFEGIYRDRLLWSVCQATVWEVVVGMGGWVCMRIC